MKKKYNPLKINLFFLVLALSLSLSSQSEANYTITFTGTWNTIDHSDNGNIPLPSNDHWSNLVGTTHNSNVSFWNSNELASKGIEDVAEEGNNTVFFNEVDAHIINNNADQWLQQAFNPNHATGSATIMSITVSEDFPLLTLISMIAPSPDWFVGIHDLSLLNNEGNWIDTMSIDLFPYDAGTEEGNSYSVNNNATNPHQPISSLVNVAPFNNQKIGTLNIIKSSSLSITNLDQTPKLKIYPNPTSDGISIVRQNYNAAVIRIYNLLGKQIAEHRPPNDKTNYFIDLTDLPNGLYIIKAIDNKGDFATKKIIKI